MPTDDSAPEFPHASADAEAIERYRVVVKENTELKGLLRAIETELGYSDGELVANIKRLRAYYEGELEHLRNGSRNLAEYARRLQDRLPVEVVAKMASDTMKL